MNSAQPVLSIRELCVAFRSGGELVPAVSGVSIDVSAGETVAVVGASGAGKSTLLAAIAGLIPLSAGRIERRVPVAALGHANGLRSALTIAEHVRLWRTLYPFTDEEARDAAQKLSLAPLFDARAGALSAGQARRAAFLRIALSGAGLLLLDEPTAGMDASSAAAVVRLVEERARRGAAALIATHEAFPAAGARMLTLGAA